MFGLHFVRFYAPGSLPYSGSVLFASKTLQLWLVGHSGLLSSTRLAKSILMYLASVHTPYEVIPYDVSYGVSHTGSLGAFPNFKRASKSLTNLYKM